MAILCLSVHSDNLALMWKVFSRRVSNEDSSSSMTAFAMALTWTITPNSDFQIPIF